MVVDQGYSDEIIGKGLLLTKHSLADLPRLGQQPNQR